ncbi:MAG: hypothetical protein IPJ00_21255 [Saprospirales bacterium]|nr:hypothetical protein [Saprospirales bacterium]
MARSKYSLNALLLDNPGMFIPHATDEFYPGGDVALFDKSVMLGWYESPTYFRSVSEAVSGAEAVGQRQRKSLADTVRLADWVDVQRSSEPWAEQGGTAATWTEA